MTFKLAGRKAYLRDICCQPKQVGACKIVGPSLKGPEYVIVEWSGDRYNEPGDVSAILLSHLDVR